MTNESKDWAKFKEEHDQSVDTQDIQTDSTNNAPSGASSEQTSDNTGSVGALEHPSYEELEDKLFEAEQKAQENWESAIRSKAELDNGLRRAQRDIENAHKYGTEKLIKSLIPALYSLEQALQLAQQDKDASMTEGLELTMKQFADALSKHGVTQIDPMGEIFNPEKHEAMTMQPNPEVPPNTVIAVFQKGYELNGRVIQPAQVVVSKNN